MFILTLDYYIAKIEQYTVKHNEYEEEKEKKKKKK